MELIEIYRLFVAYTHYIIKRNDKIEYNGEKIKFFYKYKEFSE